MHWYKGAEWRVNMASTFFGLSISYKGLQAAQTSITTTAHNLSNINTDGYTKQGVLLQASDALRTYSTYGTIGSGVNVVEIKQTRDSYYDEKYRNNCANYGQYEAKNNYMTQVEDYLNEFLLSGFSKEYGNFFDAVNQLTITPADTSAKNQLINNAKSMTDYFNTLAINLRNVQADANNEVKDTVEHINTLAQNITALNKQINQIEACYGDANDLRDQRNALVDELSKAVNITVSETEIQNGLTSFQITINGQSLVNDYSYRTLEVVARGEVRNTSDADGLYDIKWNDGSDFNIYSDSLGGQLKALIDIRDGCNGEIESYAKNDDGTYKTDIDGNIVTEVVTFRAAYIAGFHSDTCQARILIIRVYHSIRYSLIRLYRHLHRQLTAYLKVAMYQMRIQLMLRIKVYHFLLFRMVLEFLQQQQYLLIRLF